MAAPGGLPGAASTGGSGEFFRPSREFLDSQQSIRNSDDLLARRAGVIKLVFGRPVPTRLPDAVEPITDEHFPGVAIERLTIQMDDLTSIVYLIHPPKWAGGLALYHQGHLGDFRVLGKKTILRLLEAGHQVLAFAMPMRGMNTHGYERRGHRQLANRDHPLGAFAEPVVVALNWAQAKYSYSRRFMVGISGGAWATVLVAAIDQRIDASYAVGGPWPYYLRELHKYRGDYEQNTSPSYLELYLMATYPGRKQVQVFNVHDPCCFAGLDPYGYLEYISGYASELGGHFDILMDFQNKKHTISPKMLEAIVELERSETSFE